jgi:WD40 repeat protein
VARGEHLEAVNSLAFSNEGILVTGARDNSLRLWKVPDPAEYKVAGTGPDQPPPGTPMQALKTIGPPLTAHVGSIYGVAFSADGTCVASGGADREVILWDPKCYLPDVSKLEPGSSDFVIALSPDGKYEVTGYTNGEIYCREVGGKPPNEPTHPARHATRVVSVGFSRDGRFLISTSNDSKDSGTVIVTEIASPQPQASTFRIEGKIAFAALSQDGQKAAITLRNGQISMWNVASGTPVNPPLPPPKKKQDTVFLTAVFSPDGKRLAAGGENEAACIWDLETHKTYATEELHTGKIWALEFSPLKEKGPEPRQLLASGSGDTTVLLWDAATGKAFSHLLTGHKQTVRSLAFSHDGAMLASGSLDMSVILWDIATRRKMGLPLLRNLDSVRSLAFSPDDKLYSSSYYDNTVEWDLAPSSIEARSQNRANHNLTRREWEVYMEGPYRKTWDKLPDGDAQVAVPP